MCQPLLLSFGLRIKLDPQCLITHPILIQAVQSEKGSKRRGCTFGRGPEDGDWLTMIESLNILVNSGLGPIRFGMKPSEVAEYMGQPSSVEHLSEAIPNAIRWEYNEPDCYFFFFNGMTMTDAGLDFIDTQQLYLIGASNPKLLIFGRPIIGKRDEEMKQMFLDNGFGNPIVATAKDDLSLSSEREQRLDYSHAHFSIYCLDGIVTNVQWTVSPPETARHNEQLNPTRQP
jgi:hypothetical protein